MKTWITKALDLLRASLEPPRHELNELDWKAAPSPDKKRLTEHHASVLLPDEAPLELVEGDADLGDEIETAEEEAAR